jgi:hypothetical protein
MVTNRCRVHDKYVTYTLAEGLQGSRGLKSRSDCTGTIKSVAPSPVLAFLREGFAGPSTQTCDDSRELCQEQAQGRIEAQRFYASRNGHSFSVLRRTPKVFAHAKSNDTEFPDNNHSNREAKRPNKLSPGSQRRKTRWINGCPPPRTPNFSRAKAGVLAGS